MKIMRVLVLPVLAAAAGCNSGDGVLRPAPSDVHLFNAASNLESVRFLREEFLERSMTYGDGGSTQWDSGQYDLNVEFRPVGSPTYDRTFSQSVTLQSDQDYTFVVIAPTGDPEFLVVATPEEAADPDNNGRYTIIHAFEGLGDVDVYMEEPGTPLDTTLRRGTLSYGATPVVFEVPTEIYHLYLTAPGDPATVIFESVDEGVLVGDDHVLVVSDPNGQGTLSILVSRIALNTGRLGEVGQDSQLRIMHGIDDRLEHDIYLDDVMSPPLFPAQAFGVISDFEIVSVEQHSVITTPLNNPGTEEATIDYFAVPGRLITALIAGDPTAMPQGVVTVMIGEDLRSISGQATLRFLNAAGLFSSVEIFVEAPGTDITDEIPYAVFGAPAATERLAFLPGDYEITIRDQSTMAILAGPQAVTIDDGGVYGVLLLNGPGGSTIDLALYDDFIP